MQVRFDPEVIVPVPDRTAFLNVSAEARVMVCAPLPLKVIVPWFVPVMPAVFIQLPPSVILKFAQLSVRKFESVKSLLTVIFPSKFFVCAEVGEMVRL